MVFIASPFLGLIGFVSAIGGTAVSISSSLFFAVCWFDLIWLRYSSSDVSRAADGTSGDDFSLKWEINHSSFCGLWWYIIHLLLHRIILTEIWTRILTNIFSGDQKSEQSRTWGVPRHIFLLWSVNWFFKFIVTMIKYLKNILGNLSFTF